MGLSIVLFYTFLAIFASLISPYTPFATNIHAFYSPPSLTHLFGTNNLGQDILSQCIYGARISLIVGFAAVAIILTIGILMGLFSGYYGGIVDQSLMRITDFFLVLPAIILMIIIGALVGSSLFYVVAVISLLSWPSTARVVRSMVLTVKEWSFIESPKISGASNTYIIFKHILPNTLPVVFATAVLNIGGAIFAQAAMVFLGVGDITDMSWGVMLHNAMTTGAISTSYWWVVVPPGICLASLILGFSLLGYALEEIFNPRIRRVKR